MIVAVQKQYLLQIKNITAPLVRGTINKDIIMEVIKEKRERTPEENLAIAKIQVMMEDSFGLLSNSESSPALQDRAKRWFDSADCSLWCDMAGTTHDHVIKLFQNLQYNYNTGKITKDELRFGIRKLEKKL